MRRILLVLLTLVLFFGVGGAIQAHFSSRIFDLQSGREMPMSAVTAALKENRIILIGEHHNNENHHRAQLGFIRALRESGARVAIGLEMFRSDSQKDLDRWIAGTIDEKRFQEIYYDNWNFPWSAYRMIFEYAREHKLPLVGLNVPRDITRKVSRQGFQSLSEAQKGALSDITCRVDKEYMDYIRKAFGAHGHGNLDFTYFCEAQLVWDNVMAVNSLEYLKNNPDAVLVLLAGTGHVQKGAIPRQIRQRSEVPHAVILPEVEGIFDSRSISTRDADYIILDL